MGSMGWELFPADEFGRILAVHESNLYAVEIWPNGRAELMTKNHNTEEWELPKKTFKGPSEEVMKEAERRIASIKAMGWL